MLNAVVNEKLCQVTNFSDTAILHGSIFTRHTLQHGMQKGAPIVVLLTPKWW